ncbi:hypothetical protein GE09DRAFT_21453 [Coniochaeta sp. 2T2.1]|nr:hypothetical protein GE09DRAFT_21453 [Coniochaeta sp. 2T2.1]
MAYPDDVPFEGLPLRSRRGRRGGQNRPPGFNSNYPRNHDLSFSSNPNLLSLPFHRKPSLPSPNNPPTHSNNIQRSSEQLAHSAAFSEPGEIRAVADSGENRYEDGEVRRFGAGESYRPFNNRTDGKRSPRPRSPASRPRSRSPAPRTRSPLPRARSPLPRARSPVSRARSPGPRREQGRTPPPGSDSYVPGRASPRRRSRSIDRYRRPSPPPLRADTWRRNERSRSRVRSPPRRGSPPRRASPPPRRASPRRFSPRRDDRGRSPRRDFDARANNRSRSPLARDRDVRPRSPLPRRSPPAGPRGGGNTYRPRSRSPDRRDDRSRGDTYRRPSPPPKGSHSTSAVTSQNPSRRSSPRPASIRGGRDDRSRPQSPQSTPRDQQRRGSPAAERTATPLRSPPRGPAALRQPPSGPSGGRNFTAPNPARAPPLGPSSSRNDIISPPTAPAGPRGYVPGRGGFGSRGGRGGWGQMPPRHVNPSPPPVRAEPSNVPTGPRAGSVSAPSGPSTMTSKPFNPPTGPAAAPTPPRPTLAQNLINTMPPIIPGGRLDPSLSTSSTGLTKELEAHNRKLKEEEDRIREEMRLKQERLRKNLRMWDRHERETRSYELKSDLSERSLKNLAGEGLGGAAF